MPHCDWDVWVLTSLPWTICMCAGVAAAELWLVSNTIHRVCFQPRRGEHWRFQGRCPYAWLHLCWAWLGGSVYTVSAKSVL